MGENSRQQQRTKNTARGDSDRAIAFFETGTPIGVRVNEEERQRDASRNTLYYTRNIIRGRRRKRWVVAGVVAVLLALGAWFLMAPGSVGSGAAGGTARDDPSASTAFPGKTVNAASEDETAPNNAR